MPEAGGKIRINTGFIKNIFGKVFDHTCRHLFIRKMGPKSSGSGVSVFSLVRARRNLKESHARRAVNA
jgi:hypothetical protein